MTTKTMTIQEALDELKLLDSRIVKGINKAQFSTFNKHSNTKLDGKPIADFEANAKSSLDEINDLIRYQEAIKREVILKNATTTVTIDGVEMTVAEAIYLRDYGIGYRQSLLQRIATQYEAAKSRIAKENGNSLTVSADDYVIRLYGNAEKAGNDEVATKARKAYIEANTFDLIDPINSEKVIKEQTEKIDAFTSKVKTVLTISNATTIITVTY